MADLRRELEEKVPQGVATLEVRGSLSKALTIQRASNVVDHTGRETVPRIPEAARALALVDNEAEEGEAVEAEAGVQVSCVGYYCS